MRMWRTISGVSGLTLVSRVLGYIRDFLMALKIGAGPLLDAYLVAFQIPNFMRRLFGEGAFTQAFVPTLSDVMEEDQASKERFVREMLGRMVIMLCVVTVLVWCLAPWVVWVYAPGFAKQSGQTALTAHLLRWTFPYLILIVVVALFSAVLNTHKRFYASAAAPILLNIGFIAALLSVNHSPWEAVHRVSHAVPWIGAAQVLWMGYWVQRLGLKVWPLWRQTHPAIKRVFKMMWAALYGVSVGQLGLIADTFIATFLVAGSVSWLYFANRLTQLPLALIGVTLATVSLPSLARSVTQGNQDHFHQKLDWMVHVSWAFCVPAAIGLGVLARPLILACLSHGQFDGHDVVMTVRALQVFALGIPAMALLQLLFGACYAQKDVANPVRIATGSLVVNLTVALATLHHLAHVALALAQVVAAWFQVVWVLRVLKHASFAWQARWSTLWQPWLVSGVMGVGVWELQASLPWDTWFWWQRGLGVAACVSAGMVIYAAGLWLLGWHRRVGLSVTLE